MAAQIPNTPLPTIEIYADGVGRLVINLEDQAEWEAKGFRVVSSLDTIEQPDETIHQLAVETGEGAGEDILVEVTDDTIVEEATEEVADDTVEETQEAAIAPQMDYNSMTLAQLREAINNNGIDPALVPARAKRTDLIALLNQHNG